MGNCFRVPMQDDISLLRGSDHSDQNESPTNEVPRFLPTVLRQSNQVTRSIKAN